jgi:N-acetyl-gamma-glutamyl-phosphate reductase
MIKAGLISADTIVADIKSGLSGGGRAPGLKSHFSESNEGISVDAISGHNQKPEIEQELSKLGGISLNVTFIPHQASLDRGILATVYSRLNKRVTINKAHDIYSKFYSNCNFVRILDEGTLPRTKNVRYSNLCDLGFGFQDNVFVSVVAIDNLVKGASGQAVQNMNLMFNFPEAEGLDSTAIYP